MPEDDRAVRARLEALEAEVKAEADASRARKDVALAKVREQRAEQLAERQALRDRQAELVGRRTRRTSEPPPTRAADDDGDGGDDDLLLGTAGTLELARKAQTVRSELAKPRKAGDKSWKTSGLLSLAFGPIGWLYAGSMREAIPAAAAWLALAAIITKVLPFLTFLMLPVLLIAMPLSGIAGIFYAAQYNKHGKRMRLFSKDPKADKALAGKKPRALPPGR